MRSKHLIPLAITGLVLAAACAGDRTTGPKLGPGRGLLAVRLTDAPLAFDSIAAVNVFVVRVDARRAKVDSGHVDDDLDDVHFDEGWHSPKDSLRWVTIATPDSAFNLLNLRDGLSALLGASAVDTGHFRAVRLVIDPSKSSIVLKDGTVLSDSSQPPIEFEKKGRHGLFVELADSGEVTEGETTTLTLDLKLNRSLSLRGRTIHDGFLFRPVVAGHCEHHHN